MKIELAEDMLININELIDNVTSKKMIGNIRKAKRICRRNNKRKYYFINKFEYTPGVLDLIRGSKEILILTLGLLNEGLKYDKQKI